MLEEKPMEEMLDLKYIKGYKKDLEGVNYDLQTDYQPTNVAS